MENAERNYYPHNYKELAVRMFCEGMTIMAIARVLKIPYQTVRTWIRREGKKALKKYEGRIRVIKKKQVNNLAIDEMHSYIGKKSNDYW